MLIYSNGEVRAVIHRNALCYMYILYYTKNIKYIT